MNKIYIDTFSKNVKPQYVVTKEGKHLEIIMGLPSAIYTQEVHYQQYVNFINSILIHDKIVVKHFAIEFLIVLLGFDNVKSLLKSKRLEVFDNTNKQGVLMPDGKYFKLRTIEHYNSSEFSSTDTLEKRLENSYPEKKKQIDELLQLLELNTIFVDSKKIAKEALNEVEADLKNSELRKQLLIDSTNYNEIRPGDIYKVLRLDYINRALLNGFNSGSINTVTESSAEQILNLKYNSIIEAPKPAAIPIFQKILLDKQIPDLVNLYNSNVLSFNEILEISENVNGKKFREWYYSKDYNKDEVYYDLLKKASSPTLIKSMLKWVVPNAISLISPILKKPASFVTGSLIDKIIKEWHPNLFLDDVLKQKIDENLKIKKTIPVNVKIGRNEKCFCGSGIKYKFCHGRNK